MEYIIQLPEKGFIQGQIFEHLQVWASLVAQLVKNPPAMQETWVQSLGWEDTLEKGKIIPNKGNAKECSNCCTIVLITRASKVILKILQARLQ